MQIDLKTLHKVAVMFRDDAREHGLLVLAAIWGDRALEITRQQMKQILQRRGS